MSEIRWCDPGGHAFSTNDLEAESFVSTTRVDDGKPRPRLDICGPCKSVNAMGIKSLATTAEAAKASKAVTNGE